MPVLEFLDCKPGRITIVSDAGIVPAGHVEDGSHEARLGHGKGHPDIPHGAMKCERIIRIMAGGVSVYDDVVEVWV